MSICFDKENNVFKLDTRSSSLVLALADGKWLGQVHYGPRLTTTDLAWALDLDKRPMTPDTLPRETVSFFDCFPSAYPVANMGDFREPALALRTAGGQLDCLPVFESFQVVPGKPELPGLPATFGTDRDCETLIITMGDKTGVKLELMYTAFMGLDVITQSVRITNEGPEAVSLERAMSGLITLPYDNMSLMTVHGSWAREGTVDARPIGVGITGCESRRGMSGHQDQPFLAILGPGADQNKGEVWAMHLVYSGSFLAQVQRDQFDSLRALIGIDPESFSWRLEPGESFQTPEAVTVYSNAGIGKMTRTLHDLYRGHLIRSPWLYRPRPVLINNWEATYFDFDEERLLTIAKKAAKLGIELFVLDDGWFGSRNTDSGSLGDWQVDKHKLPHGLDGLAKKINALGMRFGLWMEPEMVSVDSDLYRAHPDWVIRTQNRSPMLCRDQLVLDLGRPEVEEYVWGRVEATLRSANIEYLKWDMNRPLTNLGSSALPPERQGEVGHRYMLALYRLQERLCREFPELLLENCASGGGRFDPGMLYFSPQIWGSDDTDAVERLHIQEGMAMLYPLSSIGSHVSACPNHIVGRVTPFETRADVATFGAFGYELDVTKLDSAELQMIPGQIERYKRYCGLVESGDYYRVSGGESGLYCHLVVSRDKRRALVFLAQTLARANQRPRRVRLSGLDKDMTYVDADTGRRYRGDTLMHLGLPVELPEGDFGTKVLELAGEEK